MIRVIGQAPVVAKDIFDMVSDGRVFRIFIPSKNTFLVGSTRLERPSKKPIENLRPQHILDALFWPELPASDPVLFEQADEPTARYYVLTLLRRSDAGLEIARKIWFDRADLHVSRVEIYGAGGRLDSDIAYSEWRTRQLGDAGTLGIGREAAPFPREIHITRPQDDYQLSLSITKLTLNPTFRRSVSCWPSRPARNWCASAKTNRVRSRDRADGFGQRPAPADAHAGERAGRGRRSTLVVVIVGLTSGMVQETAKRIEGVGRTSCCSRPRPPSFWPSAARPCPSASATLAQLKYVQAVAPVLLQFNSDGGIDVIYGIDPASFRAVSGGFVFLQGHDMAGPG